MALDEREVIRDRGLLVAVPGRAGAGHGRRSSRTPRSHLEPSLVALLGAGAARRRRQAGARASTSRRSSGRPWCSSWAVRHGRRAWSRSASSTTLGEAADRRRRRPTTCWPRRVLLLGLGRRCPASSTTSPTSRPWRPLVAGPRRRRRRAPRRRTRCGGRSPSAPTSAATPPRSAPAPTSSSSASPHATATRSRSGSSPSTALVVAVVTIALAWPYLWLRYYAFA